MSKSKIAYVSKHSTDGEGKYSSYTIGFIASVLLTFWAYILVINNTFSKNVIVVCIGLFAVFQFIIQVLFFLHLGREAKPRWKLITFLFMLMVVLILVFGSIWIMNNLNYRMTPEQMDSYMKSQSGM